MKVVRAQQQMIALVTRLQIQRTYYYYKLDDYAPGAAMVPIYQEFVSISFLAPVNAEHQARRSSAEISAGVTPAKVQAVKEVAGEYTHAMVSMPVARIGLEDAKTALRNGNWRMADAALADVQEGVEVESVEADMPLSRAIENLSLARAAARDHEYQEAKDSLEAASQALSVYAQNGGQHADQARRLEEKINQFSGNLPQNTADAVSKLEGWCRLATSWSPYQS